MKIAYYCQHVLGIGHFHRSLEICRELAKLGEVTMITGGAPVEVSEKEISFFQLPALVMDADFKNLAPYDHGQSLDEIKKTRARTLKIFFETYRPEIFLVELYPFGRKAFRFELDPVLEGIRNKDVCNCLTLCSVRDILVERHDKDKFESRVISTLNSLFDGVLVHGDKKFIPLDATFSRVNEIGIPLTYTGYVTPLPHFPERSTIRDALGIAQETRQIVASIGGGSVGVELLHALINAMRHIKDTKVKLQVFAGAYTAKKDVERLQSMENSSITVESFSPHFESWLRAADLSVSMAGYNTTMNTLAAGVPALFYPFSQNQEQRLRVSKLAKLAPLKILEQEDLLPQQLALLILSQLQNKRYTSPIRLDGAAQTAEHVQLWHATMKR
jgi:predicted glycosyltransferase